MSLKEISALLNQHFSSYKVDDGTFIKIGNFLSRPEYKFDKKASNGCIMYRVKPKQCKVTK